MARNKRHVLWADGAVRRFEGWVTAHCDASFEPGSRRAGAAWWIRGPQRKVVGSEAILDAATSMEAEAAAAESALAAALFEFPEAPGFFLRSDCEALLGLIVGTSKPKGVCSRRLVDRVASLLAAGVSLDAAHVKGHGPRNKNAASYVNDWCDKEARRVRCAALPAPAALLPEEDVRRPADTLAALVRSASPQTSRNGLRRAVSDLRQSLGCRRCVGLALDLLAGAIRTASLRGLTDLGVHSALRLRHLEASAPASGRAVLFEAADLFNRAVEPSGLHPADHSPALREIERLRSLPRI